MKRKLFALVLVLVALAMFGCGGGGSSPPPNTQIISDSTLDGEITKTGPATFAVAQGSLQSLFAGIDAVGESRAFLDFPLGGIDGVPLNATIVSATLDLFINSFQSTASTIPMRIELVSYGTTLLAANYDSSQLVTTVIRFPIFSSDSGRHVSVDVTALMEEAQRLGLSNFQIRIMEDFGLVTPGIIEINDTTGPNRGVLAPLLDVTYF
ncbi:hypothetical protein OR1_03572 [Geobacter sp. OR-1]|uniref:hypothetical protein n=1 Tax=Geobacter sp. OR-1 TaxID=1266765 RepID=UPI00054336B6|nr:hypothetical protein [Geobacter sp. OR-1]GAM11261.1 hypothetical protein OR1_03572 [Geobacter sp. OR-1]